MGEIFPSEAALAIVPTDKVALVTNDGGQR